MLRKVGGRTQGRSTYPKTVYATRVIEYMSLCRETWMELTEAHAELQHHEHELFRLSTAPITSTVDNTHCDYDNRPKTAPD